MTVVTLSSFLLLRACAHAHTHTHAQISCTLSPVLTHTPYLSAFIPFAPLLSYINPILLCTLISAPFPFAFSTCNQCYLLRSRLTWPNRHNPPTRRETLNVPVSIKCLLMKIQCVKLMSGATRWAHNSENDDEVFFF